MGHVARIISALFFTMIFLLSAAPSRASEPNPHNAKLCLLCHEALPRFGVDTRDTVTFRKSTWDDPRLCYHCHKPEENLHPLFVQPGPERLGTRTPSSLPLGSSPGLEGQVVCV